MNRNRQRDRHSHRDNRSGRGMAQMSQGGYGGGDGLLGEGPSGGNPMMNQASMGMRDVQRDNQLALAQSLIHQQQLASVGLVGGGGGGEYGSLGGLAGGMHFLQQQHQQQMRAMGGGGGGGGGMGSMRNNDRKRMGVPMRRDNDKYRRRDSYGRGDKDRSHGNSRSSGQDQDRSRHSRKDSVKQEDYDPAEPTEDDEDGNPKNSDSKLYCHVCNISVYDDESFQRHLNGLRHKARMDSVLTAHQMKSTQLKSRLKAEEHLRNIERKGGRDPDYFCKICNNDLAIPWEKHRYSNIHKQRLLQVRKGCGWCKVFDFTNFTEVLEHRDTDEHKKNADMFGKKEDEKEGTTTRERKPKEVEEDLTIPEFNAETPVGVSYVIPVTGFFCKLCNKFYNNEKSAKGSHCQSEVHYEKFKAALEVKIAEREKRRAEEEERRKQEEAEEEQLKEEKDVKEDEKMEEEDVAEDNKQEEMDNDDEEVVEEEDENPVELNNGEATIIDDDDDDCTLLPDESQGEDGVESFLESEPASSFVYVAGSDKDESQGVVTEEPTEEVSEADKTTDSLVNTDTASIVTSTPIIITEDEESPQVATPPKRATARRGRGRGRSKK